LQAHDNAIKGDPRSPSFTGILTRKSFMRFSELKLLKLIAAPLILAAASALVIGGCTRTVSNSQANPPLEAVPMPVTEAPPPKAKIVKASWYGPGLNGHVTSTGETFNDNKLTAASTTLPLGSVVKVTNPNNGKSVNVRVNDCGPYVHGRSLDLSKRAAQKIGITHEGVAHLKVTPVKIPAEAETCS
jgi:rare lipoprotein A (peptidoglycan hydrolase)